MPRRARGSGPVTVTRADGASERLPAYNGRELSAVVTNGRVPRRHARRARRDDGRLDALRAALWAVCGDEGMLPARASGVFSWAARELIRLRAGPGDVATRAAAFRRRHPGQRLTVRKLVARWDALASWERP